MLAQSTIQVINDIAINKYLIRKRLYLDLRRIKLLTFSASGEPSIL